MTKLIIILSSSKAIGSPVLGIIIPGIIFLFSIVATLLLYRHFSRRS